MTSLLIESASRSALLFLAIFVLLRLFRVRNQKTQLTIWRAGIVAALLMPFLLQVRFVSLPVAPELAQVLITTDALAAPSSYSWLGTLSLVYAIVAAFLLARTIAGLIASWRMHSKATRVSLKEVPNVAVRISSTIASPATIGSTILLPADYANWNAYKLGAVLAHETSHVRNGDYYWHAVALFQRAIFWVNPFVWWLPQHTTNLSESVSDVHAVHTVGDQLAYAELLIELSIKPTRWLGSDMVVAMARSTDVEGRVAQLLHSELPSHSNRPVHTYFSAATIAIATVVVCASCERAESPLSIVATTPAAPNPSATASVVSGGVSDAVEDGPIVEPHYDRNRKMTLPEYVASERNAGHEGVVHLALLIDTDGRVAKSKIKKSSGFELLDQAAEAHYRGHLRVIPATQNGKPIERWITLPVIFKLQKPEPKPNA